MKWKHINFDQYTWLFEENNAYLCNKPVLMEMLLTCYITLYVIGFFNILLESKIDISS